MNTEKAIQKHRSEKDESTSQLAVNKHTDKWMVPESESTKLRKAYETGSIDQTEFLGKLFNSEEADRVRCRIARG